MDFAKNLRELLWTRIGPDKAYANRKRMADALGVDPSQLNRFMDGERGLAVDTLGRILDGLGARLTLPEGGEDGGPAAPGREVCFVAPRAGQAAPAQAQPTAQDYMAVPMASKSAAATLARIPEEETDGWALVWRRHPCVRFRQDLVAVALGQEDTVLAPGLMPGDVVLVDRAERSPDPGGKIMLVTPPQGPPLFRRVAARELGGETELVFYGDDPRRSPPQVHLLGRDFGGELSRAVAGRVVWAFTDMTLR